jgi:hypothetical protein
LTCEAQGNHFSLNNILLDIPLNNVIHHLDGMKVANKKLEVERLIAEEDWKLIHSNMDFHLSFLSYVRMISVNLTYFIVLLLLQVLP